jgi:hypothetical protein
MKLSYEVKTAFAPDMIIKHYRLMMLSFNYLLIGRLLLTRRLFKQQCLFASSVNYDRRIEITNL